MSSNNFTRRSFLKTSILTGVSALTSKSIFAKEKIDLIEDKKKTIIKRKLGKTGIELPIVSLGVMRADNPALVHAAIKEGIIYFDTAHSYQRGKNEEMLGEVFQNYPRDSFVISTKVEPESYDKRTGELGNNVTSKAFLDRLDISLKRLKMDYVDILYVHNLMTREAVLFPEILEAVTIAKKSGKAKYVGVSTHRNEPAVIRAAIESGIYEVVLTSINFMQEHLLEVRKAIAEAAKAGLGIVAMKTMAGGFFDKERTKPINCKAALKFVLQDENITTAIPGSSNFDQLKINASVNYDLELTQEELQDLQVKQSVGSLYCQGCMKCIPNCQKGLPIPDIMRAYMYTYGYRDLQQAYSLLKELNLQENLCNDCSTCSVKCSQNFRVSEKIKDVSRILSIPEEFIV